MLSKIIRVWFVTLLAIASPAMAVTVYIDNATGSDSNTYAQAQSAATPWKTITKFFGTSTVTTGDIALVTPGTYASEASGLVTISTNASGKALTVRRNGSTGTVSVETTHTTIGIYVDTAVSTGSFTFENISFVAPATFSSGNLIRFRGAAAGCTATLAFTFCTFSIASGGTGSLCYGESITGSGRVLAMTSCTATVNQGFLDLDNSDSETFTNCTFTSTGATNYHGFRLRGTHTTLKFDGGTFTLGSDSTNGSLLVLGSTWNLTALTNMVAKNATFTSAGGGHTAWIYEKVTNTRLDGCTIRHTGAGAGLIGLKIGEDGQTVLSSNTIGTGVISGCTIGSESSHSLLIGGGANAWVVTTCHVDSDGDIGVVVKAEDCTFSRNTVYGSRPFYMKGANRCRVLNNSFYKTDSTAGTGCVDWVTDTDTCVNAIIKDNIIHAGAGLYALCDQSGTSISMCVDGNVYVAGSSGLAYLGGAAKADLAALKTAWATYSPAFSDNDLNSTVGDPLFVDPAAGDFRVRTGSAAITAPLAATWGVPGAKALRSTSGGIRRR